MLAAATASLLLADKSDSFGPAILVILALMVMILAGVGAIYLVRKMIFPEQTASTATPFTLQGLRELHERGDISQAEYETMRAGLIAELRRPTPRKKAEPPRPPTAPPTDLQ